jgi:cyclase
MLAKRIIPCLDIKDGQTVKGVNFVNIRNVGDPVELGARYAAEGADELVYLDITATHEKRKLFAELVKRIALHLNIPFTVGGGINEINDADILLNAGADKISINSSAVRNPALISQIARSFGSQFIVVAIDARLEDDGNWAVYLNGGRLRTDKELFSWAKQAEEEGAGEILFTSMNHDGTKNGFANEALANLSKNGFANEALANLSNLLTIPVIASGGAGALEHFEEVFKAGKADAALAASIFHFNEISVPNLKEYLKNKNIVVR